MKKIIILTILFTLAGVTALWAIKPIPSYNIPIYKQQTFVEKRTYMDGDPSPKGKRDMNVKSSVTSTSRPTLTIVYIFSTDGRDVLGPYALYNDQTFTVTVDEREWGVYATSEGHVELSVWFTEYCPPTTDNGMFNPRFNQNPLLPAEKVRQFYSV